MGIKTGISKWRFGLLAACGLSLVCGGWYGWRGDDKKVEEVELVVSAPSVGNGIVDGVECLDVENEQIEILNEENEALVRVIEGLKEELKYERLISERLKLAVLQSWSDRFDVEQQIHQQTN